MRGLLWSTLGMIALVVFERLGSVLAAKTGLGVPGSVLGFVMLALVLGAFREVPQGLKKPAGWLLGHLPLFLMPAMFGAVVTFNLDRSLWLFWALSCVAGTTVSALCAAILVRWALGRSAEMGRD